MLRGIHPDNIDGIRWPARHGIIHSDSAFDLHTRVNAHSNELVDVIRLNMEACISEIDECIPLTAMSEVSYFSSAANLHFHGSQVESDGWSKSDRFNSPIVEPRAQLNTTGGCQEAELNVSAKARTRDSYPALFKQGGRDTDCCMPAHVGVTVGIHVNDAVFAIGCHWRDQCCSEHRAMSARLEHRNSSDPVVSITKFLLRCQGHSASGETCAADDYPGGLSTGVRVHDA